MNSLLRPVSLLLLLTLFAPPAFSQKKFCPVPPPSPFKHDGQISTRFDRSSNGMRTTLQHPRALTKGADSVYLAASFVHQDPRVAVKPALEIIFFSASQPARLSFGEEVSLVADGQPMTLHRPASGGSRPGGRKSTPASAAVSLNYTEVAKLTASRKVQVRLGGVEFDLTGNHIEALRELASQMAPSPSRWTTRAAEAVSAR